MNLEFVRATANAFIVSGKQPQPGKELSELFAKGIGYAHMQEHSSCAQTQVKRPVDNHLGNRMPTTVICSGRKTTQIRAATSMMGQIGQQAALRCSAPGHHPGMMILMPKRAVT